MLILELIGVLEDLYAGHGDIPVYVNITEDGVTFWPDEVTRSCMQVLDAKVYLGLQRLTSQR